MYFKIQASFKTDNTQIFFKLPFLQKNNVFLFFFYYIIFILLFCFLKKKKKKAR